LEKTTVGVVSHILTIYPNVAKVGGLQSQGVEGEAIVNLLGPLAKLDMESSGLPGVKSVDNKLEVIGEAPTEMS